MSPSATAAVGDNAIATKTNATPMATVFAVMSFPPCASVALLVFHVTKPQQRLIEKRVRPQVPTFRVVVEVFLENSVKLEVGLIN